MSEQLPLVVTNIKSHQSLEQVGLWLEKIGPKAESFKGTIIYCPSDPFLLAAKDIIKNKSLNIKLGAQNISKFEEGAYTGEVAASQISDLVEFAIVGHSERRRHLGETVEDIIVKTKLLVENEITPILCISDLSQLDSYLADGTVILDNADKIIFVEEDPSKISGGGAYKADNPENANEIAKDIKSKIGKEITVIYGGSINVENVSLFFSQKNIDGGLVGQASVDPNTFLRLLENATI